MEDVGYVAMPDFIDPPDELKEAVVQILALCREGLRNMPSREHFTFVKFARPDRIFALPVQPSVQPVFVDGDALGVVIKVRMDPFVVFF